MMDLEKELRALEAQQLAHAIVLQSVLSRMVNDQTMRYKITEAFNQAEEVSDHSAVEHQDAIGNHVMLKVRELIKDLRKQVLGDEGGPRGLI
jgi:hypothetical protein